MTKELNPKIMEQWERLKVMLSSTEDDVLKNARGNVSAGVRARKGLRTIRKEITDLVRLTVLESRRKKDEEPQPTQ